MTSTLAPVLSGSFQQSKFLNLRKVCINLWAFSWL